MFGLGWVGGQVWRVSRPSLASRLLQEQLWLWVISEEVFLTTFIEKSIGEVLWLHSFIDGKGMRAGKRG